MKYAQLHAGFCSAARRNLSLLAGCFADDDNFDLPLIYDVNGHSLHFGRHWFFLVTGFIFGLLSFHEYRNGDIPFRNRLFSEKIGYDVKIIDVLALIEDEDKFSKVSDEDRIRVCLLLSLEVIFKGRELVLVVDGVFFRMVDNLDAWNLFPRGGLYGEYLNKRSAACAAKQKDNKEFHRGREKGREAALIDRVRDLESLCESLLTLPKEVKSLRGRVFKLKSIIQVITLKNGIEKEQRVKKFSPQIEDLLQSTSEDEPDIKDDTSLKERQHGDILKMAKEAEQKIESEIQRLYNHREASETTHDEEFRPWYLKMRKCLEEKIHVVLEKTGVFEMKNIDPAKYKICFRQVIHIPKQDGVFGDFGVFLCMFLYRLPHTLVTSHNGYCMLPRTVVTSHNCYCSLPHTLVTSYNCYYRLPLLVVTSHNLELVHGMTLLCVHTYFTLNILLVSVPPFVI
nr:phospholipase-like, aminotransferase-like mobile domain protein [Tanacetum cinerariifolium]